MKKVLKTVLILLVVLIIALGVAAYFNRDTIEAFLMAFTASEEELQNKVNSSGNIIDNNMLSGYTDISLRDLTDDEKTKLANNEISEEDAVALVMGMLNPESSLTEEENTGAVEDAGQQDETATDVPSAEQKEPEGDVSVQDIPKEEIPSEAIIPDAAPDENKESVNSDKAEAPVENTAPSETEEIPENNKEISEETQQLNKKIAELVAKLYVVKARVTSNLDTYIEELRAEILEIPTTAERKAAKPEFAARAIKVVAKWEKECDSEINTLLDEIETLLKDSGQSLELVDTIRKAYKDEKAAKKAYCINRYLD